MMTNKWWLCCYASWVAG